MIDATTTNTTPISTAATAAAAGMIATVGMTTPSCDSRRHGDPDSFRNRERGAGDRRESFPTGGRGLHGRLRSRSRAACSSFHQPQGCRTGIGREEGSPCRKEKVGQQSGGQHILVNGFSEESVESAHLKS